MAGKGPSEEPIRIRAIRESDRPIVREILLRNWGRPGVVSRGKLHPAHTYPGFVAVAGSKVVGLLTYQIRSGRFEIVTLDALLKAQGIGTRLLRAAERAAKAEDCKELWLITTNDNLRALRFYQRRGMMICKVHPNALEASRKIKPSIPRIGCHGIALRDEIELSKPLINPRTGSK